jgi:hypothetical protein
VSATVLVGSGPGARGGELDADFLVIGRGLVVESRRSWLEGGFGRLTEGADPPPADWTLRAQAHVGLDYRPSPVFSLRVHGLVRAEPGDAGGARAALVEGFAQYRPELTPRTALRVRAGLFFPPTSRENVDPLWQSPYTLTLSALNTWIGEEVRLAGLEATVELATGAEDHLDLGGAVLVGNDPAGALLAWRGWALGDRLTGGGEVVPLPPLPTLAPGAAFGDQRSDGTRPVDELDGRAGWHARARWSRPGRALLQVAFTDNRADRALYRGQYAWRTRFGQAGAELTFGGAALVVEAMLGDTGMGPAVPGGPRVDVRFQAGYALFSWASASRTWRLSARYDRFDNDDRDGTAEPNGESGWAFTVAAFWRPRKALRLGVEYLDLRADRPAAAFSGASPVTDARRAQLELRFRF